MSLHVWALSHGVADLFVEARPGVAKLPLPPEEILKSAMLRLFAWVGHSSAGKSGAGAEP